MATMTCPAWMTGQIKTAAGEANAGKWDIAAVPGGGGNWGGSFLTVPRQSKHAKEAAELADFLTSAASQKKIFTGPVGALPSSSRSSTTPRCRARSRRTSTTPPPAPSSPPPPST
ncbi:extracellular solute-binding protein [Streptomyces zhihengii]